MLALIRDGAIVSTVYAGGWFDLPDGSRASPAHDGWTDGEYRLAAIQPADPVPEGKRVVSTDVQLIDGQPRYVNVLEDVEPEQIKASLAAYAAQKRYEKEIGGTIWNGWPVHTDRESQSKIIAERLAIEAGERDDPDYWKFADGVFRAVSNDDFISLSSAVRDHVRSCFAIEGAVLAAIEAGTITSETEIDAAFE